MASVELHPIARAARLLAAPVFAAALVILGTAGPARAAGAADTQPPTAPGQPVVSAVTTVGFTLTWPACSDNVGVTGYQVRTVYPPGSLAPFRVWKTATNTITITDLVAGQTVPVEVRAVDAAGNVSPPSPWVTVTTRGPVDRVPPTAPGTPVVTALTPRSVTLSWQAATDNVAIMVYAVQELAVTNGVVVGSSTTTSTTLGWLNPGRTYVFAVVAVDAGNNRSPRSAPVTVVTPLA